MTRDGETLSDESSPIEIWIEKRKRRLVLRLGGSEERIYDAVVGRNVADKRVEGDEATPLGSFYVCAKNPRSRFFLSLALSYPNAEHAERGRRAGLIDDAEHEQILRALREQKMPPQHTRLGGEIYIHGRAGDGTRGCIAVDDAAMQEIYDLAGVGTPVHIVE